MSEIKEFNIWFKEFETNFGFTAYAEVKNKLFSLLQENEELRKSRAKWRLKFEELRDEQKKKGN